MAPETHHKGPKSGILRVQLGGPLPTSSYTKLNWGTQPHLDTPSVSCWCSGPPARDSRSPPRPTEDTLVPLSMAVHNITWALTSLTTHALPWYIHMFPAAQPTSNCLLRVGLPISARKVTTDRFERMVARPARTVDAVVVLTKAGADVAKQKSPGGCCYWLFSRVCPIFILCSVYKLAKRIMHN